MASFPRVQQPWAIAIVGPSPWRWRRIAGGTLFQRIGLTSDNRVHVASRWVSAEVQAQVEAAGA